MEKFKCKRCSRIFDNYNSLRKHVGWLHGIKSEDFHLEFYLNGIRPTCKCGCGEETNFNSHGFCDYKRGHISRVKNNWGHNPKAIEHSAETRRQQYKDGVREPWNKGLDITDERVRLNAENSRKTILADKDLLKRKSERMKKMWKDGVLKVEYGAESPAWCGGNSSINAACHGSRKLYNEWKFPILKKYEFKCSKCGAGGKLDVHHNQIIMSEIINIIRKKNNFDDKLDRTKFIDAIINYHTDNEISGVALCRECHRELHNSFNF